MSRGNLKIYILACVILCKIQKRIFWADWSLEGQQAGIRGNRTPPREEDSGETRLLHLLKIVRKTFPLELRRPFGQFSSTSREKYQLSCSTSQEHHKNTLINLPLIFFPSLTGKGTITYFLTYLFMSDIDLANNLEQQGVEEADEEDIKLLKGNKSESPHEQFARQRKMAQECCDLGRKHLSQGDYESAIKEFSKAVMTFEYILKNNLQQKDLKNNIADMHKTIILPAYSNLSLSYLKTQKYDMVITFANQVIAADSANVKNIYRRGQARKFTKAFDEAIEDFEKVVKLDSEMEVECKKLIAECKLLKLQQKKKDKEIAKQFIQGYAKDKPEPTQIKETTLKQTLWQRSLRCVRKYCPRFFSKP